MGIITPSPNATTFKQSASGGFHSNDATPGRIHRFNDRIFVAASNSYDGTFYPAPAGRSWLGNYDVNGGLTYIERDATLAVTSAFGGIAVCGNTRTSDAPLAPNQSYAIGSNIGFASIAYANDPTRVDFIGTKLRAYGFYTEAIRDAGCGTAHGFEMEVCNRETGDARTVDSYNYPTDGATLGLWLGSGAAKPDAQDATLGIAIFKNGARFKKGMVFYYDSLTLDGNGRGEAIDFGLGHELTWRYSGGANAVGAKIRSDCNVAATQTRLVFAADGLRIKGVTSDLVTETTLLAISAPTLAGGVTNVDRVTFLPQAAGSNKTVIAADGADTNVDVEIRGRGTLGGMLNCADTTTKFRWATTGIAFFGGGLVARQTAPTALATDGSATSAQMSTAINALRTALVNYNLMA